MYTRTYWNRALVVPIFKSSHINSFSFSITYLRSLFIWDFNLLPVRLDVEWNLTIFQSIKRFRTCLYGVQYAYMIVRNIWLNFVQRTPGHPVYTYICIYFTTSLLIRKLLGKCASDYQEIFPFEKINPKTITCTLVCYIPRHFIFEERMVS